VDRLSETFELVRVLVSGGVLTAAVVQAGLYFRERLRSRNRVAEIQAESAARRAEIEAANRAEIAKLQVELHLERERNRALTSSQLSIGPPSA
jgi:hypothetical protein